MTDQRGTLLRDSGLCVLAAIGTFVAFPTALAPEHSFWPLIWLSHVPLLWILKDKPPKAAFWWGLICGTLINAGGYYWLATMLRTFGHLPWVAAGFLLILHSIQLGLIWGVWAWLVNRITNTTSIRLEWSAPIVMVAVEFCMPRIFPAYMGNSQYLFPPIMQVADIFGVTVVTFLIYRFNAVAFLWLRAWREDRPHPIQATWVTVAMLVAALSYGGVRMYQFDQRMDEARKLRMGIVEADVGIFQEEPVERRRDHLLIHQNLSAALERDDVDLIIWSESAYRFGALPRRAESFPPSKKPLVGSVTDDRDATAFDRRAPMRGFRTPLLFGATTSEPRTSPRWEGDFPNVNRNTAFLLDEEGAVVGSYDKVYLLVFGEYVPFVQYMPWFYDWIPAAGNLEPGQGVEVVETDIWGDTVRLGVLVCYEGILPGFARQLSGQNPHVIINMTNDDWFGKTAERYLHFALTVPRAIEHRVPFIRSTLTGVSAFVDANGRVVKETSMYDPETIAWDVPLLSSETIYQRIGDTFPWGCVTFTIASLLWGRVRRLG